MGCLSFKLESLYLNLKEHKLVINGKEIPVDGIENFSLTADKMGWHVSGSRNLIFEVCQEHEHLNSKGQGKE